MEHTIDKERILQVLRSHAPELQAAGIAHLRLFGSVARGDHNDQSDIDLMADLDPTAQLSLFGFSALRLRLTDLLGSEVDLSSDRGMKDRVRRRALKEAVVAF